MTNENEYIYRHRNEAAMKYAETDQIIRIKQMEIVERSRKIGIIKTILKILFSIVLGLIGAIFLIGAFSEDDGVGFMLVGMLCFLAMLLMWGNNVEHDLELPDGKIRVPQTISDYENMNYSVVKDIFENAGFTNIKCVALNDLKVGLLKSPGWLSQ